MKQVGMGERRYDDNDNDNDDNIVIMIKLVGMGERRGGEIIIRMIIMIIMM